MKVLIFIATTIFLLVLSNFVSNDSSIDDSDVNAEEVISVKVYECTEQRESSTCAQQAASFLVSNYPPEKIMSVFEKNISEPYFFKSCHTFLHFIGRELYMRQKNVAGSMQKCSFTCFQGCHHGVLEGYFINKNIPLGDEEAITKEASTICGKKQDYPNVESYYTCLHGLGHGFMFFTDEELPKSLKMCDAIDSPETIDFHMCYNGVFMENYTNLASWDHPSKYIKADDPYYPCNILGEKYLDVCYHDQVIYVSNLYNHNLSKTINFCKGVPEKYRIGCFTAIGQKRAALSQDQILVWSECKELKEDQYIEACVRGVVLENFALDKNNRNFCQAVEDEFKDICFATEAEYLKRWGL